jgi:hypothetical protein
MPSLDYHQKGLPFRPVAEDRRRVFGILPLDEQARAAREVERVGAAGVVGFDDGRDPRRRERSLREPCVPRVAKPPPTSTIWPAAFI